MKWQVLPFTLCRNKDMRREPALTGLALFRSAQERGYRSTEGFSRATRNLYTGVVSVKNMEQRIQSAMYQQCQSRGYATPVNVPMDIGYLDKRKYEDWRAGRVPYLEAVCTANLHKLSEVLKVMRSYAANTGLTPSFSSYKHKSKQLRFSKSGNAQVEKAYATHYVMKKKPEKKAAETGAQQKEADE